MSRHTIANVIVNDDVVEFIKKCNFTFLSNERNVNIAYGFDHACGYFIQWFDRSSPELLFDADTFCDGLSGSKLGTILSMIVPGKGEIHERIHKPNIERAMLDLPF